MKIERYVYPTIELMHKNKRVAFIHNDVELIRAQIEICKEKSEDYSIKCEGEVIKIGSNGTLEGYTNGVYRERTKASNKLFIAQPR